MVSMKSIKAAFCSLAQICTKTGNGLAILGGGMLGASIALKAADFISNSDFTFAMQGSGVTFMAGGLVAFGGLVLHHMFGPKPRIVASENPSYPKSGTLDRPHIPANRGPEQLRDLPIGGPHTLQ